MPYKDREKSLDFQRKYKHKWYIDHPEEWRNRELRYRYGITLNDYDALLLRQDGRCAICGSENSGRKNTNRFCVDHDHVTGRVRCLLCFHCNSMVGYAKDSPELLRKAALMLENWEISKKGECVGGVN